MRQVIQNYKTGKLTLSEVPIPNCKSGGLLVRNINSLISAGTERQMIDLAKKSLLGKAKARPDLVKQVISKVKTDGLLETYRQAMTRLDTPVPLGYSAAGEAIEIGQGVEGFQKGDRVACSGSGCASHAEVVSVPENLCVKMPDNVNYESASFIALGGIAIHTVRLVQLTLGETVAVIGLGLLGQLVVQICKASGYKVFGIDIDPPKVALALEHGADDGAAGGLLDIVPRVSNFTDGVGADAVIIMASTPKNDPIELAAEIAREKGKIIVSGLVGLDIPRKLFYEKELDLRIPRAWGPGMYDQAYEKSRIVYPLPYVRWDARRNMAAFLDLVSQGKVSVKHLITHHFPIERALDAYEMLMGKTKEKYIGILLGYGDSPNLKTRVELQKAIVIRKTTEGTSRVGYIGAGVFSKSTHLPNLKKISNVVLRGLADTDGPTARDAGEKVGFEYVTSDYKELLVDSDIDTVMIATRHNLHARIVTEALEQGKDVFVEKPLAMNAVELDQVAEAWRENPRRVMVGFNRRFSPFVVQAKELLGFSQEPLIINIRVNAGFVPKDSWILSPKEGGDRIVGEVCHFIDLIQYLSEALPVMAYAQSIRNQSGKYSSSDNLAITLTMDNGSVASIVYTALGDKAFPREKVEVFRDGSVCVIENFRRLSFVRAGRKKKWRRSGIAWGHREELEAFFKSLKNGETPPVDFKEYLATTLATFAIQESIKIGKPVDIDLARFLVTKG